MYCHQCGKELGSHAKFCPHCGAKQPESVHNTAAESSHRPSAEHEAGFQQSRFIISIVTMLFTFMILFQSCAAGLSNSLSGNLELGGTAGFILCICWWVAGILNLSRRTNLQSARNAAVAYIVAGAVGLLFSGSFTDLKVYSVVSFVFAAVCYAASKSSTKKENEGK